MNEKSSAVISDLVKNVVNQKYSLIPSSCQADQCQVSKMSENINVGIAQLLFHELFYQFDCAQSSMNPQVQALAKE